MKPIDEHKRKHLKWSVPVVASVVLPAHAITSDIPKKPPCRDIEREITRIEEEIIVLKEQYTECRKTGIPPILSFISDANATPQCDFIMDEIEVREEKLVELRDKLIICQGGELPEE